MSQEIQFIDHLQTPIGLLEVTANAEFVTSIYFVEQTRAVKANVITDLAKNQLSEYFSGHRRTFSLPLSAQGTDFQHTVWQALTTLEYGTTCAYADIANLIDNPKGVRAVGLANSKNPMTVVVPCHRVIGKNGNLTGYAGGTERKAWLLKHEGVFLI